MKILEDSLRFFGIFDEFLGDAPGFLKDSGGFLGDGTFTSYDFRALVRIPSGNFEGFLRILSISMQRFSASLSSALPIPSGIGLGFF